MNLDYVIAEWSLGLYPPERMPVLALWALEAGFDGPALRELASLGNPTRSGEEALIERALRELGKEPLDPISAGRSLVLLLCNEIVSGKISPYEGARRIWSASNCCGMPKSLNPFIGYASEWEDDLAHRNHYDKLIIQAATQMLQKKLTF